MDTSAETTSNPKKEKVEVDTTDVELKYAGKIIEKVRLK
jgi:hypothetical protein